MLQTRGPAQMAPLSTGNVQQIAPHTGKVLKKLVGWAFEATSHHHRQEKGIKEIEN